MAKDVTIILERLDCIRQFELLEAGSEPYIWSALLWASLPETVVIATPTLGNERVVLRRDMRAGQTADIPASVGRLRVRVDDDVAGFSALILVVALWEEDETPGAVVRAGFQAFRSGLRSAIADDLVALFTTRNEAEEEEVKERIKTRVQNRVRSAIEDRLTLSQKFRVAIGELNLDDNIDNQIFSAQDIEPDSFTLRFTSGSLQEWEIPCTLLVQPVGFDRCQSAANAVASANAVVERIETEIRQLQTELQGAPPGARPGIIAMINRLRREDLADAMEALDDARRALQSCREHLAIPIPDEVGRR